MSENMDWNPHENNYAVTFGHVNTWWDPGAACAMAPDTKQFTDTRPLAQGLTARQSDSTDLSTSLYKLAPSLITNARPRTPVPDG